MTRSTIGLVLLATVVVSGDKLLAYAAAPTMEGAPVLLMGLLIAAATLALNPNKLGAIAGRQSGRKARKPRAKRPVQVVRP